VGEKPVIVKNLLATKWSCKRKPIVLSPTTPPKKEESQEVIEENGPSKPNKLVMRLDAGHNFLDPGTEPIDKSQLKYLYAGKKDSKRPRRQRLRSQPLWVETGGGA